MEILPIELQKYIASFLAVYTRYGLPDSHKFLWDTRKPNYYTKIRKVPRGLRSNFHKKAFFLRHCRKTYEWMIWFRPLSEPTSDIWTVQIFDTWDSSTIHKSVFEEFINSSACWEEDPDVIFCSDTHLSFYFIRSNEIQSRQSVLFELTNKIRSKYQHVLEGMYKKHIQVGLF